MNTIFYVFKYILRLLFFVYLILLTIRELGNVFKQDLKNNNNNNNNNNKNNNNNNNNNNFDHQTCFKSRKLFLRTVKKKQVHEDKPVINVLYIKNKSLVQLAWCDHFE